MPVGNDVAIPERTLISKEDELQAYFEGPPWHGSGAMSGLTEADSDFIDQLFANQPNLSFIKVDRNRLRESHEAWVHVLLHETSSPITQALGREGQLRTMTLAVFSGFGQPPLEAILTWANSD